MCLDGIGEESDYGIMTKRFICGIGIVAAMMFSVTQAFGLTGSWRGELKVGQTKLPLVFNFSETAQGKTECTLDSPSQGAKGIPVTVTLCTADSLSLECGSIGAAYNGTVSPSGIKGFFRQHGYSFPLDLSPDVPLAERRPQTPQPPFPYTMTDTVFAAPDGAVMSATLTMPVNSSRGKVPCVVMVTGSGPQNRDEELFDHRPFAVIADCLARNGIASLRYDDRGTGRSGGDFLVATTRTFKDDAEAAVKFVRSMPAFGKVGVLGHSEGGTIAFMLGAEYVPDFIVSLAGLAVPGREALMKQNDRVLERGGVSGDDKERSLRLIGLVFDAMAAQSREGCFSPIDIDSIATASGLAVVPQVVSDLKMTQKIRTPWFDALLLLDPAQYLAKVSCPLMAVNGDKDTQVESDNLEVIKKLVPAARIRLMPGLNHMMQHAVTGEADEYDAIRETISPEVLDAIVEFVGQVE